MNNCTHTLESIMPGVLASALAVGENRRDRSGPGPEAASAPLKKRQALAAGWKSIICWEGIPAGRQGKGCKRKI